MPQEELQSFSLITGKLPDWFVALFDWIIYIYRYRRVPTFGRGTIRQFHKNASAMKRLAAQDFKDLLQVSPFYYNPRPYQLTYLVRSSRF